MDMSYLQLGFQSIYASSETQFPFLDNFPISHFPKAPAPKIYFALFSIKKEAIDGIQPDSGSDKMAAHFLSIEHFDTITFDTCSENSSIRKQKII